VLKNFTVPVAIDWLLHRKRSLASIAAQTISRGRDPDLALSRDRPVNGQVASQAKSRTAGI
jgi:hypothetical protein